MPTKIEYCLKKCLLLQRKIRIDDKNHLGEKHILSRMDPIQKNPIPT
jgi:hypothetical protein